MVDGTVMAGQISGLIKEVKTCSEIIKEMVSQAQDLLDGGNGLWEK